MTLPFTHLIWVNRSGDLKQTGGDWRVLDDVYWTNCVNYCDRATVALLCLSCCFLAQRKRRGEADLSSAISAVQLIHVFVEGIIITIMTSVLEEIMVSLVFFCLFVLIGRMTQKLHACFRLAFPQRCVLAPLGTKIAKGQHNFRESWNTEVELV